MNACRALPLGCLMLIASTALGQTAGMLSFQGLIKDAGGVPVTGTVDLEFRIYDAEIAGNLVDMDGDGVVENVCSEDVTCVVGVSVSNGILSTKIRAKTVRRARYVTFQMGELAVPWDLFRAILTKIRSLADAVPAPSG